MGKMSTAEMHAEISRGLRTYKAFAKAEELTLALQSAEESTRVFGKKAETLRQEVESLTKEKAELAPRVEALKNAEEAAKEAQAIREDAVQYAQSVKEEADAYAAQVRGEASAEVTEKRNEADELMAKIREMRESLARFGY